MDKKEIYARVKAATFAIVKMRPYDNQQPFIIVGSGCCIDPQGIVVTCRHVLSGFMSQSIDDQIANIPPEEKEKAIQTPPSFNLERPYVLIYKTNISSSKIFCFPNEIDFLMAEMHYDIGLLRMAPRSEFSNGYPYLEIEDYKNISEGMNIGTCGFPLGNYLYSQVGTVTSSFTQGIVSSIIPAEGTARNLLRGF